MPRVERSVDDISSCEFYHVIDLPSGTSTSGQWDIRGHAPEYLGDVNFHSKQVIEIGPASGFLSFYMEECGAKVTCIEPPLSDLWDFVPQRAHILDPFKAGFIGHIQRIRNGFWYCHTQRRSKVALYEESPYALPSTLGLFDVGVLAAILLHCNSPVRLIQSVADLVGKTIIITDLFFHDLEGLPVSRLAPGPNNPTCDTWWQFSTQFFTNYLPILGFTNCRVSFHSQKLHDQTHKMFTVVGERP
jgi:hypothetical protein